VSPEIAEWKIKNPKTHNKIIFQYLYFFTQYSQNITRYYHFWHFGDSSASFGIGNALVVAKYLDNRSILSIYIGNLFRQCNMATVIPHII